MSSDHLFTNANANKTGPGNKSVFDDIQGDPMGTLSCFTELIPMENSGRDPTGTEPAPPEAVLPRRGPRPSIQQILAGVVRLRQQYARHRA